MSTNKKGRWLIQMKAIDLVKNSKFLRYYYWMPISRKIRMTGGGGNKAIQLAAAFPVAVVSYLSFFKSPHQPKSFKYEAAIVAIVKNEGAYLREWVEYHKKIGFQKFYIYNNDSTDDTNSVLKDFVSNGTVDLIQYSGKNLQCFAYNDAIDKHKNECHYMAAIDLDEFILPMKTGNIKDAIDIIEEYPYAA